MTDEFEVKEITWVGPTCPYCGKPGVRDRAGVGLFCSNCDKYCHDVVILMKIHGLSREEAIKKMSYLD